MFFIQRSSSLPRHRKRPIMKKTNAGKRSVPTKKATSTKKKAAPAVSKPSIVKKSLSATKPTVASQPIAVKPKAAALAKKSTEPEKKTIVGNGLTVAELENFNEKLLVLRARLRGDVITMTDAALNKNRMDASGDLSAMPIHMADLGSDNFEQEQTLSFMQSEHGFLEMVDEALMRLKEGKYGICEGCECWIPRARLNAIPYAAQCVTCAASDEQND